MTRGVGFDKYWDEGGAVSAGEAAGSLIEWVRGVGIERTGEFWAPRGAGELYFIFLSFWVVGEGGEEGEWKGRLTI